MTNGLSVRAPKYHRVADILRCEIRDGDLAPGQRPPAEATLVE